MNAHDTRSPRSIAEYLDALRSALQGADPALIQDALSDAETHLRAECAARPSETEESVLLAIAGSYGLPEDVAAAYRETDQTVQAALAPRSAVTAASVSASGPIKRFFSIYSDVRSWSSIALMMLSLFTGILYFCVVTIGLSLSLGLAILIIGIPFFITFIGLTRVLALVEGRLVEAMTGERMPRRAQPATTGGWLDRIGAMLSDLRTWSTLVYQLLALPVGVINFTLAVSFISISVALIGAGAWEVLRAQGVDLPADVVSTGLGEGALVGIGAIIFGILMLTVFMHLARLMGRLHAKVAKRLLVAA
ncbi:MAG: sensor domain-containing protein [Gammaproteobacteria bacterium]